MTKTRAQLQHTAATHDEQDFYTYNAVPATDLTTEERLNALGWSEYRRNEEPVGYVFH